MRDAELIGVRPIAGHQEPTGKPRLDEDVADAIVWCVKHLGKQEINLLAASKQMLTILAGQGGEQKICSGGPRRF
jgi:hypothetical protein